MIYRIFLKRLFDLLVGLLGLLMLSPLFVFTCIMLFFNNRGEIFFTQRRPGKNGRIFSIIKFKSMNDRKDEFGNLLSDAERLTKVGLWVRKLSLDEIPQLINVILGDMSLIGPRPLLVEYLSLYNAQQSRRHEVRPGITGWAQVNGRNSIDWGKKFEFDVWYVDNLSFSLDLKILFLTIAKVFKPQGINSSSSVTMEKFKGNQE